MNDPTIWWWYGAAAVVALVVGWIRKSLRPPFVKLELASTAKNAANTLIDWDQPGRPQIGRAFAAVIVDVVLVGCLATATVLLLHALPQGETAPISMIVIDGAMMVFVILAALAKCAANALLAITLARRKPTAWGLTHVLVLFAYTMLALTVLDIIFRGEVRVYEIVHADHHKTLAWLIAATLLLSFIVLRRLSTFSRYHPPLLSLLLAPDHLTAKGILEQWGLHGRRKIELTLLLQSLLALLYGVTLATICRESIKNPDLQRAAAVIAWVCLAAAACHLAQNFGAFIAVLRADAGWWVNSMRRIGKLRIVLLAVIAVYFVGLLVRVEEKGLIALAAWIGSHAPSIRLPWS